MERDDHFETEVTGPNSLQILKFVLGAIDTKNVNRIRVEIDADQPLELNGAGLPDQQQTEDPEPDEDTDGENEAASEPRVTEENDTWPAGLPYLYEGSDPRHVAETMYDHDSYLHSDEIAQMIPSDADFNRSQISRTLYTLVEKGLVDKQDSDRDGRMKKYRLTDKGRAVVEQF